MQSYFYKSLMTLKGRIFKAKKKKKSASNLRKKMRPFFSFWLCPMAVVYRTQYCFKYSSINLWSWTKSWLVEFETSWTGSSQAEGLPPPPQFLAKQLILSQPGGADYIHHCTTSPPGFSDLATGLMKNWLAIHTEWWNWLYYWAWEFGVLSC